MKIEVSEESVVYQGPAYEDTIWGVMQFPEIINCKDGSLAIRIHAGDDVWTDFGKDKEVWCVSTDNGLTWNPAENKIKNDAGYLLPNGDRLFFPLPNGISCKTSELKEERITTQILPGDKPEKEADGSWPYPAFMFRDIWGCKNYIFDFDTLPDQYGKKEWTGYRIPKGSDKAVEEHVPFTHPHYSSYGVDRWGEFSMMPPCPYGRGFRFDSEGNIWVTSYTNAHLNPYNGGVDIYSASVLYKSTDNGHSFELAGYIPYVADVTKHPTAHLGQGFDETALEFTKDGSMIVLLRNTGVFRGGPEWNPMYFARSTDGGKTFSEPVEFDKCGVFPNLLKLDCGVILAAYGRPGIYVRACEDPSGIVWENPVEIMTEKDRSGLMNQPPERPDFHQWAGSCCNVDLKPIGPNKAILAYSDFFYPDQSGKTDKKLKTILTRIITVEE